MNTTKQLKEKHHIYSLLLPGIILGMCVGIGLFRYETIVDHWAILSSRSYISLLFPIAVGAIVGPNIELSRRGWVLGWVVSIALSVTCILLPPYVARQDILNDYTNIPKPEQATLITVYLADDSWSIIGAYGSEMTAEKLAESYASILQKDGFYDSQYSNLVRCKGSLATSEQCHIDYLGGSLSHRKYLDVYIAHAPEDLWILKYLYKPIRYNILHPPLYNSYLVVSLNRGSKM